MVDRLPVGPYRTVETAPGRSASFYIIPFDEDGHCEGPRTRDHLLDAVRNGDYTDVFLFSHGWNNDWAAATGRYEDFLAGFLRLRQEHGLEYGREVRAVLVGIFWPSAVLVLPWEQAPIIAGDTAGDDAAVAEERDDVRELARALEPGDRDRFYALAQQDRLSAEEALELARLLRPIYARPDDDLGRPAPDEPPEDLVTLWMQMFAGEAGPDTSGNFGFAGAAPTAGPAAAGLLDRLKPRNLVRATTVLLMKDRAGRVGAHGVGPLLRDLLAVERPAAAGTGPKEPRVHLIGHSYGCKVVLSALCFQEPPRPVNSVLLLQPAISHLCFADKVSGTDRPGGYRVALDRVEQPIYTTFSSGDSELHDYFHLAVRRSADLGEPRIAGAPPSRFAALGGYGPGGCAGVCREIPIKNPKDHYAHDAGADGNATRVFGLNGTGVIDGHGDISNEHTWWALYDQVAR